MTCLSGLLTRAHNQSVSLCPCSDICTEYILNAVPPNSFVPMPACIHSLDQHPAFCTLPRRIHTNHDSENELRNKLTDQQISNKLIGIRGCSCKSLDTGSREPAVMQGEKHPQPFRLARPLILNATMDYYELWLWVDEMLHFR